MTHFELRTIARILFVAVPIACSGSVKIEPGAADGGAAGSLTMVGPASGGASSQKGDPSPDAPPATAGSGSTRNGIPVCKSPTFDASSQLVVCANGFAHRARPAVCSGEPSAGEGGAPADDSQSSAGAAGELMYGAACTGDGDCAPGTACVCNPANYLPFMSSLPNGEGACVLATCRTDADCGQGSYCALGNLTFSGEAVPGFGCLRDDDECTTDADCSSTDGFICLEETRRTCSCPPE